MRIVADTAFLLWKQWLYDNKAITLYWSHIKVN